MPAPTDSNCPPNAAAACLAVLFCCSTGLAKAQFGEAIHRGRSSNRSLSATSSKGLSLSSSNRPPR